MICTLRGDLNALRGSIQATRRPDGQHYWRLDFWVEVFFGKTSLSAEIAWLENVRLFPPVSDCTLIVTLTGYNGQGRH